MDAIEAEACAPSAVQPVVSPYDVMQEVPTSWLDPLLSGPKAVLKDPPYGCDDIERLLRAIRERMSQKIIGR